MNEEWRQVPDFSGYEVSDLGRVRSTRKSWSGSPKLLIPTQQGKGYLVVSLHKDHKRYMSLVHRLVAMTFIGPPTALNNIVHHKDGSRTNNRLDNLEWSNQSLNVLASSKRYGEYRSRKLHEDDIKKIREMANAGVMQKAIAEMFDVHYATISKIISRKTWRFV